MLRRAVLAMVVLFAVSSCGEESPEVAAAKAYAIAVQRGDVKDVLQLIDRESAQWFEQAAAQASDQIGGRRSVEPHEMLQIVDVDPRFQVAKAELVSSEQSSATVKLHGADGSEHLLQLVLEEGSWRVDLPLPLGPAPGGAS